MHVLSHPTFRDGVVCSGLSYLREAHILQKSLTKIEVLRSPEFMWSGYRVTNAHSPPPFFEMIVLEYILPRRNATWLAKPLLETTLLHRGPILSHGVHADVEISLAGTTVEVNSGCTISAV